MRQLSQKERSRESEEVKLYQGHRDNSPGASEQVRESSQGSSRRNKGGLAKFVVNQKPRTRAGMKAPSPSWGRTQSADWQAQEDPRSGGGAISRNSPGLLPVHLMVTTHTCVTFWSQSLSLERTCAQPPVTSTAFFAPRTLLYTSLNCWVE